MNTVTLGAGQETAHIRHRLQAMANFIRSHGCRAKLVNGKLYVREEYVQYTERTGRTGDAWRRGFACSRWSRLGAEWSNVRAFLNY